MRVEGVMDNFPFSNIFQQYFSYGKNILPNVVFTKTWGESYLKLDRRNGKIHESN